MLGCQAKSFDWWVMSINPVEPMANAMLPGEVYSLEYDEY